MKNTLMGMFILVSFLFLHSCSETQELQNNPNTSTGEENTIISPQVRDAIGGDASSGEISREDAVKNVQKNLRQPESTDARIIAEKLKKCEAESNPQICKSIVVEIEAENQKNVAYCEKLGEEASIGRCKIKIATKLASRELNPAYCESLEEMDQEMCKQEVKNSTQELLHPQGQ